MQYFERKLISPLLGAIKSCIVNLWLNRMAGIFVDSVAQPSAKIKCIPSYENNNFRFQRETFLTSFFAEDPT